LFLFVFYFFCFFFSFFFFFLGELDAYITMTGPLYEINRALQDMLYQPDRDYNTHGTLPDVITLTLDDVNGIGLKGT
jgi:hypothetical protein